MTSGYELLMSVQAMQKKICRINEILGKGKKLSTEQRHYINEYKDKIEQAINYVNSLGEPAATILTLRYLTPHGDTGRQLYWYEIARRINYEADSCRRIDREIRNA